MCGIAGFSDFFRDNTAPMLQSAAGRMGNALARRGPDDAGVWAAPACALAHRRLAVIDPAHGHQPMVRTLLNGDCALVYNGELYNTPLLRRQLEGLHIPLETQTDTEVLLWQLILFGADALDKLEGIFAFAFWDGRKQELLLARDRFGVKPLFFAQTGTTLLFGSEPKALFAYPGFTPRADDETWQELLAICPARTPGHGVFADVHELQPGECARFDGVRMTRRRWYALRSLPHREDYADTVRHVRTLLTGAIRRQLVSDVPLATLLSGGLDSSIITAAAANDYAGRGQTLDTYSFDYTDNARYFQASAFQPDADAPWAERMRQAFSTRHTVLTCPIPALVEELNAATAAKDLPGMGDVDASLLWFCREIRKRHTVVLSGECADEIFGGYPWFHRRELMENDNFPWSIDFGVRTGVLRPELVQRLDLEGYSRRRCAASRAQTPRLDTDPPEEALRREIGWLNLNWFMTNLLDRKDRMSMYSGLEVRVPFCDHHLVEYVWNIPWSMKSRNGQRKQVLRDAAEGLLPEDVRNRPKSPYPKTHNPLFGLLAAQKLSAILDDANAPLHAVVDEDALRSGLLQNTGDPGRPWFGQLMAGPQMLSFLIQLNCWMERFSLAP